MSVSLSMPTYFRASAWLYLQDGEVRAAGMTSRAPHKRAHRKRGQPPQPEPAAPRGTCSRRRAPRPPGWPSWQRCRSGGLRSPSRLQPERRRQRHAAPAQARGSRSKVCPAWTPPGPHELLPSRYRGAPCGAPISPLGNSGPWTTSCDPREPSPCTVWPGRSASPLA